MNNDNYAHIKPLQHDLKDIKDLMLRKNKSEYQTLSAINSLANETFGEVSAQQKRWNTIKNLALFASFVLLVITLFILYLSPMLTQKQFAMEDIRVWGMGGVMVAVAVAVAIVIDIGRSKILDRSNNSLGTWSIYTAFTVASIALSITGMLALANFYESSNQTDVKKDIDTARAYLMTHASYATKTMDSIDAEQARLDKKYHTKGTGYKYNDHKRDSQRLATERHELNKYLSAKAVVEGKADIMDTTDSSNWLFNTYSQLLHTTASLAALFIGIVINLISEAMALVAHSRLIKLNARIQITERQWNNALMASDRAVIVNSSSLQQVANLDTFQHVFAMPFSIINKYQEHNVSVGSFSEKVPPAQVVDTTEKLESNPQETQATDKEISQMRERYLLAKNTKVGESFLCPACASELVKTTRKMFCSSTGKGNCKDHYHNTINPSRLKQRRRS